MSKDGAPLKTVFNSGGYNMVHMISEVYEENPDIVALFGDVVFASMKFTAAMSSAFQVVLRNMGVTYKDQYSFRIATRRLSRTNF
ncbi:UNVERIFIED_CONTAM: hypothetical protein HDU68_001377 [Siphonaria sp. JEL0065]|nr:hypothetical protein HDU68_001377 [Siphonaria sp. JEL0065]